MSTTGIGGSETCHAELAYRFARDGYDVISIAPVERCSLGPGQSVWTPLADVDDYLKRDQRKIWLIFRDPTFFDKELKPNRDKYYFIAQDVDYDWTDERLAKVDKYICLCKEHAKYTISKYPVLKDKVFISSNGIDTVKLKQLYNQHLPRESKRIIYSSSPDRGLELILENWFRVEERHPDAKLDVYYGFDNMLKISGGDPNHRLTQLYYKIMNLASKYPKTVTLNGRIPQTELWKEMVTSSIWFYPSDWPETSCITCMEMQALGVYPILNNFWAQGENTFHGTKIDGVPQKDVMVKCVLFKELNNVLSADNSPQMDEIRNILSEDALDSFSWDKISKQYGGWFNE